MALTATVSPSDATETSVVWSSSDENIASVSNGTVTGVGAGTATITATALDGSDVTGTYTVTVEARTETAYAEGEYNFASDYTTLAAYTLAGKGFAMSGGESHSYGWVIKNGATLTLKVSGNCTVTFTGSIYSAGNVTASVSEGDGTVTPESQSCKTETDKTGTYEFVYTGDEATLVFGCESSSTQAYTPSVTVTYSE